MHSSATNNQSFRVCVICLVNMSNKESSKAIVQGQFQNIELRSCSKVIQTNRSQFFRSLVSNNRLIQNTSKSSHESANISDKTECDDDFIQDINVLFKKNWPS